MYMQQDKNFNGLQSGATEKSDNASAVHGQVAQGQNR